ncbi:MAG: [FeFe] hydrogenase, group A [Coriobacteriia bacterium]|nr:[FeFe] hydrogenase, group A [Coriobacteriia bacterium]
MSITRETIQSKGVISIQPTCKGCDDCVAVCPNDAITVKELGTKHSIDFNKCVNCGQCLITCPFGRIEDVSMVNEVKSAIGDPSKFVMVQVAPAVRASLAVAFGQEEGVDAEGKMFAAMKELGFDKVYDTTFSADLTILEEGHELIARVMKSLNVPGYEDAESALPQFTSCCPGWVRFAELNFPDQLEHLSTAKSPMQMHGAVIKTYGAERLGVAPSKVYSVAVMPCTAKKFECSRPEFISSGYNDVDAVITTRELAQMIKDAGIDFNSLEEQPCDDLMGEGTGAGVIFGNTGGVMEAALRTAYAVLSGKELEGIEIADVRGEQGVRDASVTIPLKKEFKKATGLDSLEVKVAIVSGAANVKSVMADVAAGNSPYHFVEVMTCPGGCVNGGGQIINHDIL